MTPLLLLLAVSVQVSTAYVQNIHGLFIYGTGGDYGQATSTVVDEIWTDKLREKLDIDPTWPFNLTWEFMDTHSDCSLTTSLMESRLNDTSREPILAIVAEGDLCGPGSQTARVAARFGVPIIMSTFKPDLTTDYVRMPDDQNTSFLMMGPSVRAFREIVNTFLTAGAESAVVVGTTLFAQYNTRSCFGAADLLESRGVNIMGRYVITHLDTHESVTEIIKEIKVLNPDVVMWCSIESCTVSALEGLQPLPIMQELDYLPKAMSLLDCIDNFDYLLQPGESCASLYLTLHCQHC